MYICHLTPVRLHQKPESNKGRTWTDTIRIQSIDTSNIKKLKSIAVPLAKFLFLSWRASSVRIEGIRKLSNKISLTPKIGVNSFS